MWDTKIGKSIERHYLTSEDEDILTIRCRRCGHTSTFGAGTALVYILGEAIYHLQSAHGAPPGLPGWSEYLEAYPAPENPS